MRRTKNSALAFVDDCAEMQIGRNQRGSVWQGIKLTDRGTWVKGERVLLSLGKAENRRVDRLVEIQSPVTHVTSKAEESKNAS